MVMTEVMRQRQAFGEETSAHLGSRFADFAIEMARTLDNRNTKPGASRRSNKAVAAPENAPPITATS